MMFSFKSNEGTVERIIDSRQVVLVNDTRGCRVKMIYSDTVYEIDHDEYIRVKKLLLGAKNGKD